MISQYIVKMTELSELGFANADVNKDNIVDVKDLSQLKKYLIKALASF